MATITGVTTSPRRVAGLLVALLLTLAALVVPRAHAETGASGSGRAVTVTPARPMAGERTRFSGRIGAKNGPAALERRKGKRWVTVARGKVRNGKFKVTAKVRKPGTYRVRAGGSTSKKVKVRLAAQAAQMGVGAPFVAGLPRQALATLTPARAGRVVSLQRLTGTTWSTVATGTTDGAGVARIPYAGGPVGTASYRVVGERHRGSAATASAPQPVRTAASPELVSAGTSASEHSSDPSVSADGRWVAFSSESPLLPSDTDDDDDIYLFDRVTGGLTHLVAGATGHVNSPILSGDGRHVAFQSDAIDLAGEPGYDYDVFVLDRATGQVELVSTTAGGTTPADDDSYLYDMSDDGRVVAFTSTATDLVASLPPPDHTVRHAYVRTRGDISRGLDRVGLGWSDANVFGLDLSADGRRVTFQSGDTDLDPGDVDGSAIFAWDVAVSGTISGRSNLTPDIDADSPSLSGTGDVLAFTTAEALSAQDLNGARDTYLRVAPGSFVLAGPYGAAGNPGGTLSDDARYVTMGTKNVLPGDTNGGQADIVVWERASGTSTLVTRAGAGASGEDQLSADGSVLVFGSAAAVAPGATGNYDVFAVVMR
ncbi:WD40 repeat protein [Nocardioides sp. SLBN-35]|nr:WD40 repeat protein [Nocardioides sp. SLBN-35]